MNWLSGRQVSQAAFFWPALWAASAGEAARVTAQFMAGAALPEADPAPREPQGATPSTRVLDLRAVRLHAYDDPGRVGVPALICAPLALHGAVVADLAPNHSLVAALRGAGVGPLFLADWRSATADMAFLGIDDYLATLNVLVDHIGGPVDLIGLCQGGWLSLVFAARFPEKVRRLVIVGTPVDPMAQPSELSTMARATPLSVFQGFVEAGRGRVLGRTIAGFWGADALDPVDVCRALQVPDSPAAVRDIALAAAFDAWNGWTIDLPGTYYIEVIDKLYKHNDLVDGRFVALGQAVDLSRLRLPIYALAGADDDVVAPAQVLAVSRLVGTPPENLRCVTVPGGHLSLFMGRATLEGPWRDIAAWLKQGQADPPASTAQS